MTYLLTFPQWEGTETKEELLENLIKFWEEKEKKVEEAIICIENHGPKPAERGHDEEDPGVHIHMCFKLNKKHTIRNPDFFDKLVGKHGNIQTCRDYKACQIYCNKEGNVICHNVDIEAVIQSTRNKKGYGHNVIANYLMKKPRDIKEVTLKYPEYVLQYYKRVNEFMKLLRTFDSNTIDYPGISKERDGLPKSTIEIIDWLECNLPPAIRPMKQKQLWIWGPTSMGKTTLRETLSLYFKPYNVCIEEGKWWSGFEEDAQIAFFEEFNGYKSITQLKCFLDGSTMSIPIKGEQIPLIKKKNLPCIIMSNEHPDDVFSQNLIKHPGSLDPLYERLTIVEAKHFIAIPWNNFDVPIDLTGPSSHDDDKEEMADEKEEVSSEGDVVPPTPPRPLKRSKALTEKPFAQELLICEETLHNKEQSSEEQINIPPGQEDEEIYDSSEESEWTRQQRIMEKIRKQNKGNK